MQKIRLPAPVDHPPIDHPSVWTGEQMRDREDWLYTLQSRDLDELAAMIKRCEQYEDLREIRRADIAMPTFAATLNAIRTEILHGRGFCQIRGFPVELYTRRQTAIAYWAIGMHIGDEFVSQNAKGHLLGHITNLGESRANASQRGPYSNETIPFHVDCCDIVGLLCLQTAPSGGASMLASSGQIFNAMLAECPELVAPLCEPIYRDRRDEIPKGREPWYAIPIFNRYDDLLSVTIEPTYIGSVRRHFNDSEPHREEQLEGIRKVQELAKRFCLHIDFQPGDIQLLHNHTIVHSREAFADPEKDAAPRHLLRLWMINYDGRPLPDAYYERHGRRDEIHRPGGIVGHNTTLNVPLDG